MVLGKLSLRGRPIIVGQGSTSLAVGAGGAVLTFYFLSPFSLSLEDGPI